MSESSDSKVSTLSDDENIAHQERSSRQAVVSSQEAAKIEGAKAALAVSAKLIDIDRSATDITADRADRAGSDRAVFDSADVIATDVNADDNRAENLKQYAQGLYFMQR